MAEAAFRTTKNFQVVARHLEVYCGINQGVASRRLHELKEWHALPGDFDVVFDFSGVVYIPRNDGLDEIGNLTTGGKEQT